MSSDASKTSASCPSCRSHFFITDQMLGKKAKCPKCGQPFIIEIEKPTVSQPPSRQPPVATAPARADSHAKPPAVVSAPPAVMAPVDVALAPPARPVDTRRTGAPEGRAGITVPWWAIHVGVPTVAMLLGYFIGREHLKYQLASAFTDMRKSLVKGMESSVGNALSGIAGPDGKPGGSGDTATPNSPAAVKPQVPTIEMGQTHDAGQFTVQVTGARISPVRLRGFDRTTYDSDDPYLLVSLIFHNEDERRALRFQGKSPLGGSRFTMRDDVDNVVRPVGFGVTNKIVGAIDDYADLKPEESLQHNAVFEVPLPKTQSLSLTVDLACLGGEGEVRIEIPYESVEKAKP